VSIASSGLLLANFRKVPKILSETDPKLQIIRSQKRRVDFVFLRQSLVLVRRYRNVEFDLPETNTKNVTVGGILKIGVTFWINSAFYGEKLATPRQSSSRGTFQPSLATKSRTADFWRIFENTEVVCRKRVSDRPQKLQIVISRNGKRYRDQTLTRCLMRHCLPSSRFRC
jgi:hypothetical protein